jgi:hypothetical protein
VASAGGGFDSLSQGDFKGSQLLLRAAYDLLEIYGLINDIRQVAFLFSIRSEGALSV